MERIPSGRFQAVQDVMQQGLGRAFLPENPSKFSFLTVFFDFSLFLYLCKKLIQVYK
jgi:hypothetical protein